MTKVTVVPIYNLQGDIVNKIEINDELTYVSGRVCKGKNYYYKGVGVPYSRQHVSTLDGINEDEYEILGETGIFYLGYAISKKVWQNKYGIFQDRYQSIFPDFIGGCGSKEGLIVLNSEIFPKSAVEVIDAIMYDEENQHSYYILNYKGNRKSYVDDGGDPKKLKELVDFMLQNNWNFLWDKAAINDINPDGLVTDVADLFMSDQIEHQLGTVYSVLYSLANINQKKYIEFLKENKLSHVDQSSFIFNSIKILKDNGIKTSSFFPTKDIVKNYKHVVLKYLLTGKNCAYCSCDMFTKEGNMVKDHYIQTVSAQMRNM